jgi:hypothetical protein
MIVRRRLDWEFASRSESVWVNAAGRLKAGNCKSPGGIGSLVEGSRSSGSGRAGIDGMAGLQGAPGELHGVPTSNPINPPPHGSVGNAPPYKLPPQQAHPLICPQYCPPSQSPEKELCALARAIMPERNSVKASRSRRFMGISLKRGRERASKLAHGARILSYRHNSKRDHSMGPRCNGCNFC